MALPKRLHLNKLWGDKIFFPELLLPPEVVRLHRRVFPYCLWHVVIDNDMLQPYLTYRQQEAWVAHINGVIEEYAALRRFLYKGRDRKVSASAMLAKMERPIQTLFSDQDLGLGVGESLTEPYAAIPPEGLQVQLRKEAEELAQLIQLYKRAFWGCVRYTQRIRAMPVAP